VEGLKVNWNKVRDRSTETDVRSSTLVKMVDQFKDHILAVTLRHDASRIVQSVLQFGTVEQKETILASLCAKASEIAKTPYGHFTILKAVTYCTRPVDQRKIVAALKGHFVSLGGNVIGSRTVESVLQLYPHTLTRNLKAEFYGQVTPLPLRSSPSAARSHSHLPVCHFALPFNRNSACCCPRLPATCTR
jgi:pumilio family protein 6